MKGKNSGGFRLFSFRQGDRSEYLAVYALTRIAFVTPVPRQEDFGIVDFKCVLARKDGKRLSPKGAFNVQVKSGGRKLRLREGEVEWISTNMDCPLFICIVDKRGIRFRLYSCLNVWSALFYRMKPQIIDLVFNKTGPGGEPFVHRPGNTGDAARDLEGEFDVFLGSPVVDMTLDYLEAKADKVFDILHTWITLDRFNVALMRFGRAATFEFMPVNSNEVPTAARIQKIFNRGVNQHGLLDKICPLLKSLRDSYERVGHHDRVSEIDALIRSFIVDIAISPGSPLDRLLE